MSRSPSVSASPSDVDVSTRSSKSWLIASGPVGTSATASSSRAVASAVHGASDASALSTAIERLGSVVVNASRIVAAEAATAVRNASSSPAATEQTAPASRGIAFRLFPPENETSRKGTVSDASRRARPRTFTAFDRPSAMPMPE